MKLSHPLYAPAAIEETALETKPDSLKGWMSGLGNSEGDIQPEKTSETEPPKKEAADVSKTTETKPDPGAKAGAVEGAGGPGAPAVGAGQAVEAKPGDKPAEKAAEEGEEKWPRTSK